MLIRPETRGDGGVVQVSLSRLNHWLPGVRRTWQLVRDAHVFCCGHVIKVRVVAVSADRGIVGGTHGAYGV